MSIEGIDAFPDDALVQSITAHVEAYMKAYDASHSWDHIERVVNMAHAIYARSDDSFRKTLDLRTIHLAALLHDVGDRKQVTRSDSVLGSQPEVPHLVSSPLTLISSHLMSCHLNSSHLITTSSHTTSADTPK